jgi:hypothetical protein
MSVGADFIALSVIRVLGMEMNGVLAAQGAFLGLLLQSLSFGIE